MTAFSKKYYRSLQPLLKAAQCSQPLDWAKEFGRSAPLEFEIGFGNGEYLNRLSQEEPQRDIVGAEIAWASLKRALRRLSNPPRSNVKVMLLKAEVALERCFAEKSLDVIRSLFPVPWPDERQEKKRLFQRSFLDLAANRLKDEGCFILVTDSRQLADWTLGQAEGSSLNFTMQELPPIMNTKYERKWQGGGQSGFFHLKGLKCGHPQHFAPLETAMQAYYRDQMPEDFNPDGCVGDIVVKFKEFIFDRQKGQGLLRTFVVEGSLTQDFFIRLKQQSDGRWKVSTAISSELFPTQGVARALELVANWRP